MSGTIVEDTEVSAEILHSGVCSEISFVFE